MLASVCSGIASGWWKGKGGSHIKRGTPLCLSAETLQPSSAKWPSACWSSRPALSGCKSEAHGQQDHRYRFVTCCWTGARGWFHTNSMHPSYLWRWFRSLVQVCLRKESRVQWGKRVDARFVRAAAWGGQASGLIHFKLAFHLCDIATTF